MFKSISIKIKKNPLSTSVFIVILFLTLIIFFAFFENIASTLFDSNSNGELVKLILAILGGIIAMIALRINYKRTLKFEESVKNQTTELHLNTQQKIRDRFNSALEQLSSDKDYVVIGALHTLKEIVEAEKNGDYYLKTIYNVFLSFIRSELSVGNKKKLSNSRIEVLSFAFNFFIKFEKFKNIKRKNFTNLNLEKFSLINLKIENFDFSNSLMPCQISDVSFANCNLSNSYFGLKQSLDENNEYEEFNRNSQVLHNARFIDCHSDKISLRNLRLSNVDFRESKFSQFIIYRSSLINIYFHSANKLNTPIFSEFSNVNFGNLYGSQFVGCNFEKVKFDKELIDYEFLFCIFVNTKITNTDNLRLNFINCKFHNDYFEPLAFSSTFDQKFEVLKSNQYVDKNLIREKLSIPKDVDVDASYIDKFEVDNLKKRYQNKKL